MTLVTSAANPSFIVQVSDRRLTDSFGAVHTEDATKVIYIETPYGQFITGYTGLAIVGKLPTNWVLMELFQESLRDGELDFRAMVPIFANALSKRWRQWDVRRVGPRNSRLTIMLTGYIYENGFSGPYQALITNFQTWGSSDSTEAWDQFTEYYLSPKEGDEWPTLIQRVGAYPALPPEKCDELRPLLELGKPPEAAINKMLSWLPEQSDAYPAVGPRANTVTLVPGQQPKGTYHSDKSTQAIYGFDAVLGRTPDHIILVANPTIQLAEPTSPPLVSQVPKRQPCPCGSGRQYRRCHGRPTRPH